jgi:hypothetical protein
VFQLILPFQLDLPFEPPAEGQAGDAPPGQIAAKGALAARLRRPRVRARADTTLDAAAAPGAQEA